MGVMTGTNTAGMDREVATQAINRELQDKGFLLTIDLIVNIFLSYWKTIHFILKKVLKLIDPNLKVGMLLIH